MNHPALGDEQKKNEECGNRLLASQSFHSISSARFAVVPKLFVGKKRTDCKFSGEKIVVGAVSFRQNKNRESGPTPSLSIHLDTNVGERGIKLSGGEKQRLAFARAIFQNKKVLILDEPASALDNITESSIMSMLLETCKDKTLIIVAHRLNVIKHVDKILVVKNGKIASQGDFAHLFEHCDDFRELWRKQNSHHELGLQG